MSVNVVDQIARAILYEGYLLYPYRKSALKNQQRWNFGVLYPPAWAARQTGADRSYFQMECVARCAEEARMEVSLRFLELTQGAAGQEARERKVSLPALPLRELAMTHRERISQPDGEIAVSTSAVAADAYRITVRVNNVSDCVSQSRDEALLHSLASAHAVIAIQDAEFVSQVDPPEELQEAVSACENVGVWPVLVGDKGAKRTMLGSPIILYDYPQVAPESKGDLFDATEIDEILTLRILTLTDEEKEEVRRTDERARRLLERLEAASPEHLWELHGTIREIRQPEGREMRQPEGVALKKGDRVRLHPQRRADIFDTLLDGKIGIIEAVEEDFDRNVHLAVVIEDDPGRDLGEMRQAGHRFFFSLEEVEAIE
jgi:hypothetical protein